MTKSSKKLTYRHKLSIANLESAMIEERKGKEIFGEGEGLVGWD